MKQILIAEIRKQSNKTSDHSFYNVIHFVLNNVITLPFMCRLENNKNIGTVEVMLKSLWYAPIFNEHFGYDSVQSRKTSRLMN